MKIPFNKPYLTGRELNYISDAHQSGQLSGDGKYTELCNQWLEKHTGCHKALLTHSCTAALEIAAILADIQPGDEIILPSYTFVSTANAFVLRGGIPVYIDIRPDTLNIDESKIENAITERTKVIVPVHYAGVACEMDTIMEIAEKYNLLVIEDAAQGVMSEYRNKPLGTLGHIGCYSFHETKNIISGEGGAILINDPKFCKRAEIIREKGTNRSLFFRGEVDKYTWTDIGSSYLPGEIIAAFLWAQMQKADAITKQRLDIWSRYHHEFEAIEQEAGVSRPAIPDECKHNAHMYYLMMSSPSQRTDFIQYMKNNGIHCVFHYIPLHSSPMGNKCGRIAGEMKYTNECSESLVRLPLWIMDATLQAEIISAVQKYFKLHS